MLSNDEFTKMIRDDVECMIVRSKERVERAFDVFQLPMYFKELKKLRVSIT